jgi:SAM-dependent methyltransferase
LLSCSSYNDNLLPSWESAARIGWFVPSEYRKKSRIACSQLSRFRKALWSQTSVPVWAITYSGPTGKVIAEDIQDGMIQLLRKNIETRRLRNVEVVLGTPTDPKLPSNSVDLVLMVDVYHEFSEPAAMMRRIKNCLKPGGRVVLVEFRKEDPVVPIQPLHKMSTQEVRSELEPLGFKFQRSLEFLPWQHILIFTVDK